MIKKSISTSVLTATAILSLGSVTPVLAQEGAAAEVTTEQLVPQVVSAPEVYLTNSINKRGGVTYLDARIELSQGYPDGQVMATYNLKNASGQTVDSFDFPFYRGSKVLQGWFIMDEQVAGDYHFEASLSIPDLPEQLVASSLPVSFAPEEMLAQPSSQEKEQGSQVQAAVTASAGVVEQPVSLEKQDNETSQKVQAETVRHEKVAKPENVVQTAGVSVAKPSKEKSNVAFYGFLAFLGGGMLAGLIALGKAVLKSFA